MSNAGRPPIEDSIAPSRIREVTDVLFGVALFTSLLQPAIRFAMAGTLVGLGKAMLLLLLDFLVLALLARYLTRPGRHEHRQRRARVIGPPPAEPTVLSTEEAAALLDEQGAPTEATRLTFTETGIAVRQGAGTPSYANLAWSDCAAVVSSQIAVPGSPRFAYLQFVAVHEDRIRRRDRDQRARDLAKALGLREAAAAMVWVVPESLVNLPPLILEYVDRHHPRVRIVRPDVLEDAE
jgi:hypothetical protein